VMMYGGIIWTTAGGNQGKVTEAQNWITAAATGLILALASYIILVNINPVLKDNKVPEFGISAPSAVNMSGGISNIPSDSATSPLFTEGQITQSISACQGHDAEFNNAASANAGVDPNFLRAIAVQESSCGKNTSSNSACGFMQIESGTCKSLGFNDCCSSSQQSINAAAKYVSQLRTTCCNGFAVDPSTGCDCSDPKYLAAAYNGGRGANTKSSNCAGAYTRWECTINQGNYVGTFKTYVPNVLNTLKLK
ncbi:MAG: transglycosylase SLT domain-containing protein, partial [Candidatus Falkowbacteria bacterium]|nr:transglycosylase SLT domain-containing protein [Candidatus Falkowbacteria bacterium]